MSRAKRIVVKIGSSSLTEEVVSDLAACAEALRKAKRSLVIVSSGAIALGWPKLGYRARPKEVSKLQASAARGQSLLMQRYETAFAARGIDVAQVLLTHADLSDRMRTNNARAAIAELLDVGVVPILNENDSVAVEEIKFGDNDQLAAMVTPLVSADLLVLLSDVDGLLDRDGARICEVDDFEKAFALVRKSKSLAGTGGMQSKLEAARAATRTGAAVVIGRPRDLHRILEGEDAGTMFRPSKNPISARKYWIAYTLRPRGDIVVDTGAERALRHGNKSLLAVGIVSVRGDFDAGDAVRVIGGDGTPFARGLSRMSAANVQGAAGQAREVAVHKDELILTDFL